MFRYASDQSLFLDAPPAKTDLQALASIHGVVNLHPAYQSVLIVFNPLLTTHEAVQEAAAVASFSTPQPHQQHEIPVTYNGPDLDGVAALHNLARERVVELHASARYTVAFLGFVPGFAYLTGLPAALNTPRLPSPRKVVPAGSLGIAGDQTGIYPLATPGGWQLIGHSTVELFNAANTPMSLLQPGDQVKFIPV
jgi:KipI family sensor histidine kinase inhibitor